MKVIAKKKDIELVFKFFQTKVAEMKRRIERKNAEHNEGTPTEFFNCNMLCSKRRKTHGIKYRLAV